MTDPEPYEVAWMGPARRALGRLPGKAAAAVIELAYSALAENPHRVGRPLRWELEGLRSARRGDYRVVYRVDEQAHRVDIVAVEHRADVYRTR